MPLSLDREQYDAIAQLVDPQAVIEALERSMGELLYGGSDEQAHEDPDPLVSAEVRLARRFVWLHRRVLAAKAEQDNAGRNERSHSESPPTVEE